MERNVQELIVCGWDEIFILDMSREERGLPGKTWSWRSEDRKELPDYIKSRFQTTDECKAVEHGHRILVTSSGGGVVLIERTTGEVVFYAGVPNAHSADLLPDNRLAVAASHAPNGDRLILFDTGIPDRELYSDDLPWGHGVVWDKTRQILWALSDRDIRAYNLDNWDTNGPSLSRFDTTKLPEGSGHDMYPVADSPYLPISTEKHCWLFERDCREFKPHPVLADESGVKSIAENPGTGQLVYVRADTDQWWSETIRFRNPARDLHFSGEHIYKARWNVEMG